MGTVVRIPFEVTGWEPEELALGEPGPVGFGRGTLRKALSSPACAAPWSGPTTSPAPS